MVLPQIVEATLEEVACDVAGGRLLVRSGRARAAGVMCASVGHDPDLGARLHDAAEQVGLFEVQEEARIESPERAKQRRSHQERSAAHPRRLKRLGPRHDQATVRVARQAQGLRNHVHGARHHARALRRCHDRRRTNSGARMRVHECQELVELAHRQAGVGIQEEHELGRASTRAEVASTTEAEVVLRADQPRVGMNVRDVVGGSVGAVVVDDDADVSPRRRRLSKRRERRVDRST
jgi:hypothetical protein